jgi:hypothetical protein
VVRRVHTPAEVDMAIAVLALLGVDLIVIIVFVVFVLSRRRW